jgi:hypothetical protein
MAEDAETGGNWKFLTQPLYVHVQGRPRNRNKSSEAVVELQSHAQLMHGVTNQSLELARTEVAQALRLIAPPK